MATIVPGQKYTFAELEQFRDNPELNKTVLEGHVLRMNLDGTVQFVHWTQAGGAAPGLDTTDGYHKNPRMAFDPTPQWGEVPKIRKRTPTERVDSLMARFIDDCKRTGTVPGLDDARISEIVGHSVNTDRAGISAEDVRRIAQNLLTQAERQKKERDSHFVTTPTD